MRQVSLSKLTEGINRLRTKGDASAQQLYDLQNAYISSTGEILPREGTILSQTLNNSTAGLCAIDGVFHVFGNAFVSVPSGYQCDVLVNPNDATLTVSKIWFAQPFMGFPYVVAQFSDGSVYHYWLQSNGSWTASTVYQTGSIILPDTPNGLAYQAVRDVAPNPTWTAETTITAGNLVEPTEYTGFMYRAVNVLGTTPHTGSTEPSWPTTLGGTVQEFGDFDTSSSSSGTTQSTTTTTAATPLGTNITDRYGDSATIAGQTGTSGAASTTVAASNKVTTWAPGTLYAPGAVVQPSTNQGAFINAIPNGDFENGNDGNWVLSSGVVFSTSAGPGPYQGTYCLQFSANNNEVTATMNNYGVVTPGQSVTASAYLNPHSSGADLTMNVILRWYDASDTYLSQTISAGAQNGGYRQVSVTGIAPAGAKHVRVQLAAGNGTSTKQGYADLVVWNLETPAAVSNFLYEAVQSSAGSSASTEPTWPTTAGNTVIDGTVTWKAIGTSIITWQAIPIMYSGTSQPTFTTTVGTSVQDVSSFTSLDGHVTNTSMSWQCTSRQITDTNNPNTTAVCLGASHVFAGSNDICSYSAAVDPTDWTSSNNAGYLPTGLNNYGANPVAMLALYRSNLMVFNSGGYQMWQIDPDPANMALLDAQPVGSTYPRAAQSVANDLLFLTEVGVRNLGTIGATANMQIGSSGQAVDPLIQAQLKAGTYEPRSLYYPGRGQYWLMFGPQAFVFTINGEGLRTWSRYVFPDTITDWTLNNGILYLRTAGNKVWQFDAGTLVDDAGGSNVAFAGVVQWPYLDLDSLGINKMLLGVDLVGTGSVNLQIGFNQSDLTTFNDVAGFSTSLNVTASYSLSIDDTVPGNPIPIPINAPSYSLILTFPGNQAWSWQAANLYFAEQSGGGATGP